MQKHGMLEDVAAEIGFTAATTLVDWFGGFGQIAIPMEASEDHPIAHVIGMPAFRRLVKLYEGAGPHERFLWMNSGENREIARRDRLIAVLIAVGGLGSKQIATIIGMSESSVRFSQLRVERLGILPMILKRAGLEKARGVNPLAKVLIKTGGGNSQEKSQQKPRGVAGAKSREEEPYESPLVKPPHKRPNSKKRVGVGRRSR
jgi:hypothetical protein